ncbi:SDR family NAD(P)-dependent oxidoreductase [Myxococcota bacterium]|nr:SDR family NAD(P)-dependent oxidoreductase [Myxococcota bacterium]
MKRVALVTGCSGGIGYSIAEALARESWSVYAGSRSPDADGALAEAGCTLVQLDVRDESQCRSAVSRAEAEKGSIDALVNNAGFGLHGAVEDTSLSDARQQFETNFFSIARLCQLVLPAMRASGGGHIINMSSMGGRVTFPGGAFYHASKHALEAFSDALRFETKGFGVNVVIVEPGPVRSAFGSTGIGTMTGSTGEPAYRAFRESIVAGLRSTFQGPGSERSSSPEEVAAVCLHALSEREPASRYVVGEMAELLIEQRFAGGDSAWDEFLEGLYPRPGGDRSGSTGTTDSA